MTERDVYTQQEICKLLGLSLRMFQHYRRELEEKKGFPKAILPTRWRRQEVDRWMHPGQTTDDELERRRLELNRKLKEAESGITELEARRQKSSPRRSKLGRGYHPPWTGER